MSENLDADVVIIGAGSAGAVVASRLSEDPELQVLVLEAGMRGSSFLADIPGMTMALMGNPRTDWCHRSENDPSLAYRSLVWNGGKMLGGSSAINGMVYIRGLRRDYRDWVQSGCGGWAWEEVEPFFRRIEHFEDESLRSLGRAGPLPVSRMRSVHPLTERFVQACTQCGIPELADYNDGLGGGAFVNLTNQLRGRRASTDYAYLKPAAGRPNLRILRGVRADSVRIEDGRAQGVRFIDQGVVREVRARRQVVVSAGTLQSPLILMRSGIGSGAALQALGIPVRVDRPAVGRNLQDHVGVMVSKFVNVPTYNSQMDPFNGLRHALNYLLFRRGPLSSAAVQGMAWIRSDPALPEPDVHLNFFPFGVDFTVSPPAMHRLPCVGLGALVSRPHSRGQIRLASADPLAGPIIAHQALDDERDMAVLARAVPLLEQIFQAPALASTVVGAAAPFDASRGRQSVEDIVRSYGSMGLHSVGTCRMGADTEAVVDPTLRVRGVAGLRVVDASIMPRLISANTNAVSMMIGERGADFVRQDLA